MGTYTKLLKMTPKTPMHATPVEESDESGKESPSPTPPPSKPTEATRKPEEDRENKSASIHASKLASLQTSIYTNLQALLEQRATETATFRYPVGLLEQLEDAVFTSRKKHGFKLVRNSVAVLGIAYLLQDFEENGEESLMCKYLKK